MQPYIVLYSFLIISHYIFFLGKGKNVLLPQRQDNVLFYIYSIIILLFIATRDISVGTDTETYVFFFHDPQFYYNGARTDLFFEFLGRFLILFDKSAEFFIFVTSTICFIGIFYIVGRLSKCKSYSMLLFAIVGSSSIFLFSYLSMIRQGIAITYFLVAVYCFFSEYRTKKKLIVATIFYIAAILTHGSCLFTLPFLALLYYKRITNKKIWVYLLLITYLLAALNISFVSTILDEVFSFLGDSKYRHYGNIDWGFIENKGWFNMNLLPFIALSLWLLYFSTEELIKEWYVQLFLYSVVLNNIFFDNLMWSRLIMYFTIFIIIVIPNVLNNQNRVVQYLSYNFIYIYYIYKTFSQLLTNTSGNIIVPYSGYLF